MQALWHLYHLKSYQSILDLQAYIYSITKYNPNLCYRKAVSITAITIYSITTNSIPKQKPLSAVGCSPLRLLHWINYTLPGKFALCHHISNSKYHVANYVSTWTQIVIKLFATLCETRACVVFYRRRHSSSLCGRVFRVPARILRIYQCLLSIKLVSQHVIFTVDLRCIIVFLSE